MRRWGAVAVLALVVLSLFQPAGASYRGDFPPDSVLNFKFTTVATSTGLTSTLSGSPGAACYKDGTTSPTTNSVSIIPDWNSIVGLNNIRIDTSVNDGFFSEGSTFDCVIAAGTVGGTSVVGYRVVSFSIARNTANLWQVRTATASTTTAQLGVNVVNWKGTDVASTNVDTNVQRLAGVDVRATRFQANVVQWNGTDAISTQIDANVRQWRFTDVASTNVDTNVQRIAGTDVRATRFQANVVQWNGTDTISTQVDANVRLWRFTDVASTNVDTNVQRIAGVDVRATRSQANVVQWNGTDVISTHVSANVRQWNSTDVISTAVTANTTQIAGAAVSTSSAQLGVNVVNISGAAVSTTTAQIGANVAQWNGTDVISTQVDANLTQWRGSVPNVLINSRVPIAAQLQKNVARTNFTVIMTDSTNHAPTAGLADFACERSIDGAAFATGTLTNFAEVASGTYRLDFGAGDLNGNAIMLKCVADAADTSFLSVVTFP